MKLGSKNVALVAVGFGLIILTFHGYSLAGRMSRPRFSPKSPAPTFISPSSPFEALIENFNGSDPSWFSNSDPTLPPPDDNLGKDCQPIPDELGLIDLLKKELSTMGVDIDTYRMVAGSGSTWTKDELANQIPGLTTAVYKSDLPEEKKKELLGDLTKVTEIIYSVQGTYNSAVDLLNPAMTDVKSCLDLVAVMKKDLAACPTDELDFRNMYDKEQVIKQEIVQFTQKSLVILNDAKSQSIEAIGLLNTVKQVLLGK